MSQAPPGVHTRRRRETIAILDQATRTVPDPGRGTAPLRRSIVGVLDRARSGRYLDLRRRIEHLGATGALVPASR
jgi:hypothetical protein